MKSNHNELLRKSKVGWFSKEKVVKRFCKLRDEVRLFFMEGHAEYFIIFYEERISSPCSNFVQNWAFLNSTQAWFFDGQSNRRHVYGKQELTTNCNQKKT